MFAEFICRPISGEYKEKHFGGTTADYSWVKFTNDDGEEWVGSFQRGWLNNSDTIKILDNREKVFIVANGAAYLIDMAIQEIVNSEELLDVKTVLVDDEQLNIYYSNGYDLKFVDMQGNETVIFNYNGFDDIELIDIKGTKLYATYFDYQYRNKQFNIEVDLITKHVYDSFYFEPSLINKAAQNAYKSKPWWKLW